MVGIMKLTTSNGNVASLSAQPKDLLVFMDFFDELSNERQYKCLQSELKIPNTDVNTIGLKLIQESSKYYANIDTLLTEINILARSYMIFFKNKNPRIYKKAKEFQVTCCKEATTIQKCPDCYELWKEDKSESQKEYFKLVCPKPHLVVFYKVDGFPIWPAKLFYIKDGLANVECFGLQTEDDVLLSQCFPYSNKITRENADNKKKQEKLNRAYKEVEEHIKLIDEKFGAGSFVHAPSKITVSNLEQHLKDMFPGVYGQSSKTIDDFQTPVTSTEAQRETEQPLFRGPSTSNDSTSSRRDVRRNMNNSMANDQYTNNLNDSLDDSEELDNNGDSTMNENPPTLEVKTEGTQKNGRNQGIRKRRHGVYISQANPFPNRKSRASESGNSSRTDEEEIITSDDDEGDSEETNATPESKERVLKEYENVIKKIFDHRAKVEKLEKRKDKLGYILLGK